MFASSLFQKFHKPRCTFTFVEHPVNYFVVLKVGQSINRLYCEVI